MQNVNERTQKMIALGLLSAMAYVVMLLGHVVPAVEGFLQYEPKDVVIVIAGFIYGPLPAAAVTIVVSLIEMVTISRSGPIGLLMNVLSSLAFCLPAAIVYKKQRSLKGAIAGLVLGVFCMTGVMLAWNWLITPLYMKVPREVVMGMLIPLFLPFNLVKGALNAALTVILYKPLVKVLRKGNFAPKSSGEEAGGGIKPLAVILSVVVAACCILLVLVWQGVI